MFYIHQFSIDDRPHLEMNVRGVFFSKTRYDPFVTNLAGRHYTIQDGLVKQPIFTIKRINC